eukprot:jgi/Ulvmu1/6641/UM003_0279.1
MKSWHVITVTVLAIHCASVSGLAGMKTAHKGCAEVDSADDLSSKVAVARPLEACYSVSRLPELSFRGVLPLAIKAHSRVTIRCDGAIIDLYSDLGPHYVAPSGILDLQGCNIVDSRASHDDSSTGNATGPSVHAQGAGLVFLSHGQMQLQCGDEEGGAGFMQPGMLSAITVSTIVQTPGAAAMHLLHGFLRSSFHPTPDRRSSSVQAASVAPLIELRNETVWCGRGWDVASAAVAAAVHVATSCGAAPPAPLSVQGSAAATAAADGCMHAPSIRAAGALHLWGSSAAACVLCVVAAVACIALCIRWRRNAQYADLDQQQSGKPVATPAATESTPLSPPEASEDDVTNGDWISVPLQAAREGPAATARRSVAPAEAGGQERQALVRWLQEADALEQLEGEKVKPAVAGGPCSSCVYGAGAEPLSANEFFIPPLAVPAMWPQAAPEAAQGSGSGKAALWGITAVSDGDGMGRVLAAAGPESPGSTQHGRGGRGRAGPTRLGACSGTEPVGAGDDSTAGVAAGLDSVRSRATTGSNGGTAALVQECVAAAVRNLQARLQEDLQADHLQLHAVLGRGGFGVVHQGEWRGLPVAIKTMDFRVDGEGGAAEDTAALAQEAAIAINLVHRNVVATYYTDVRQVGDGDEDGAHAAPAVYLPLLRFYLVQEFCNGGSLREAVACGFFTVDAMPRRWGPLMLVLADIAGGMAHMHAKRICHGDLNPSNILLKFEAAACTDVREALSQSAVVAKLTDFGMAARLRDGEQYVADVRQGTPFYIAPEVVREHRLHTASDVYAFGVIMWELMRGCFSYLRGPPARTESGKGRRGSAAATRDGSAPDGGGGAAADRGAPLRRKPFTRHPDFPDLPSSVPLTYTLAMKACLSRDPGQRPTFGQLQTIISDLQDEVARGHYINSQGRAQGSLAAQGMPCDTTEDTWDPELPEASIEGGSGPHTPLSSQMLRSSARSIVSMLPSIPNITDAATDASGSIAEPAAAAADGRSGSFPFCAPPPFGDPRRMPAFRGSRVWGAPESGGHGALLARQHRAASAPACVIANLPMPGRASTVPSAAPSGAASMRHKSRSSRRTPRPGHSVRSSMDSGLGASAGDVWDLSVPLSLTQGIYSGSDSASSSSLDYELGDSPTPRSAALSAAARAHIFEDSEAAPRTPASRFELPAIAELATLSHRSSDVGNTLLPAGVQARAAPGTAAPAASASRLPSHSISDMMPLEASSLTDPPSDMRIGRECSLVESNRHTMHDHWTESLALQQTGSERHGVEGGSEDYVELGTPVGSGAEFSGGLEEFLPAASPGGGALELTLLHEPPSMADVAAAAAVASGAAMMAAAPWALSRTASNGSVPLSHAPTTSTHSMDGLEGPRHVFLTSGAGGDGMSPRSSESVAAWRAVDAWRAERPEASAADPLPPQHAAQRADRRAHAQRSARRAWRPPVPLSAAGAARSGRPRRASFDVAGQPWRDRHALPPRF